MTNDHLAAVTSVDPMQFAQAAERAGGGWWAAVVIAILVIGGGWLMKYFIGRHEALVADLKESHGQQTQLLVGVVKDNTKAMTDQSTALVSLKEKIDARFSIRGGQNG